jgi:cytoskeletal protein RodZ
MLVWMMAVANEIEVVLDLKPADDPLGTLALLAVAGALVALTWALVVEWRGDRAQRGVTITPSSGASVQENVRPSSRPAVETATTPSTSKDTAASLKFTAAMHRPPSCVRVHAKTPSGAASAA